MRCPPSIPRNNSGVSTRMTETINGDCDDDYSTYDDFLDIVGPAHLLTAIAEKRHYQRTDYGSQDAAFSARQTTTANDYRCDNIELGAHRHGRITLPESRHLHHTGKPKVEPGQ